MTLTDDQLLAQLNSVRKEVGGAGKIGMSGEKRRAELVKEAHRRNLIGMKSKRKHREI